MHILYICIMKKLILVLISIISIQISLAQAPRCDGSRYIDTTNSGYTSNMGVQFGANTTIGGNQQDLLMDIYYPDSDNETERPLIILAFGGSFLKGARGDMQEMAIGYALRGYVVASIDYRLYDSLTLIDSTMLIDVVVKGMGDMRAAVRYFKQDYAENNNTYGIDTNYIFVGGASSGGILACHVGLVTKDDQIPDYFQNAIDDNGGWEGNSSSNTNYSSEVTGVISFSGAIKETQWITKNDVPVYMVHDTADAIVPYDRGQSVIKLDLFSIPLIHIAGSKAMYDVLQQKNVKSELISVPSTNHVSYFNDGENTEEFLDSIWNTSSAFIESIICDATWSSEEINFDFTISPNPSNGIITINSRSFIRSIEVYDPVGKLVSISSETTLDLGFLKPGYYFIKVKAEAGVSTVKVLLK